MNIFEKMLRKARKPSVEERLTKLAVHDAVTAFKKAQSIAGTKVVKRLERPKGLSLFNIIAMLRNGGEKEIRMVTEKAFSPDRLKHYKEKGFTRAELTDFVHDLCCALDDEGGKGEHAKRDVAQAVALGANSILEHFMVTHVTWDDFWRAVIKAAKKVRDGRIERTVWRTVWRTIQQRRKEKRKGLR